MTDEVLWIDDQDRYSRLRLIAWWDQARLSAARVLVVGAGALGNEVLKNLALVGVGRLYIVDFDGVEDANLTRSVLFRQEDCGRSKAEVAAGAVRSLNADTSVKAFAANVLTDVGLGLFRDVDVVIGCLDNREARLWVNRQCWKVNTPWIDGGIQEMSGVVKVFVPPDSACYECGMTENDYRLINLRYSCPLLRREDLLAGRVPTAPTIASLIGALQAQEALKVIHGLPVEAGKAMIFNGIANMFYKSAYQRRAECMSHETYPAPTAVELSARTASAEDLFAVLERDYGWQGPLRLHLDRDLVVSIDCQPCGTSRRIMRPLPAVGMNQARCGACGQFAHPSIEHVVVPGSGLSAEKLEALGVPAYDILRVEAADGERTILLAGDRVVVD
jgi:adenylyltransferase/sulfurtransferase